MLRRLDSLKTLSPHQFHTQAQVTPTGAEWYCFCPCHSAVLVAQMLTSLQHAGSATDLLNSTLAELTFDLMVPMVRTGS